MASPTTKISGTTLTLSQRLTAGGADTSFTVSKLSTDVFTVTSGVLKVGVGTNSEWIYFGACSVSSTSITFTSCVRGLKKNATSTSDNDTALQYDHAIGAPVEYVLHSVDINTYVQRNADETITGSLDFSGTSTFKLKLPRYTTAQRDALTTADGIIIYNTTAGEAQYCSGGSWYTLSAGSTQPLATEVVYGRVRLNEAATDPAQPTVPGINSTRILDSTSASATGQIKIASGTTGSRSATLSLHGDDTYTSGGIILARGNTGVNATTTLTHRGTGNINIVSSEGTSNLYFQDSIRTVNLSPKFGGTGADGAISGSLTIAGSDNTYIVKNYTSFAPGANTVTITPTNCILHIKVSGDCDLTGTTFNFAGKGAAGGGAATAGSVGTGYNVKTGVAGGGGAGSAGTRGSVGTTAITYGKMMSSTFMQASRTIILSPGGGGGGGGNGLTNGTGGAGGNGGGCVFLEVNGNLTFSGTTITMAGSAGSNGGNGAQSGGGGGGGGGGGVFVCLYNGTLSGSVTPTVSGGAAGTGGTGTGGGGGGGSGAGGGSASADSVVGVNSGGNTYDGSNGVAGASGYYLIEKNVVF